MAYKITSECIMCGNCEAFCHVDAITETGTQYVIDETLCDECQGFDNNPLCIVECPVENVIIRV